ncbi:hypothetical protein ACKWTF_009448 [Chironomus riparius]
MYKNFEIQFRKKLLEDKKLKDKIKKNAIHNSPEDLKSFHEVLAPVIAIGNVFSIFPVAGIFSKNVESLKFRIWYPITIYSIIVNFCLLVEFFTLFVYLYKAPFQFFMVGEYFFYALLIFCLLVDGYCYCFMTHF